MKSKIAAHASGNQKNQQLAVRIYRLSIGGQTSIRNINQGVEVMYVMLRFAFVVLSCVAILGCGSREASDADSTNVEVTVTPLYKAIRGGDLGEVKEILANDPDALYRGDGTFGETALHEAAAADEVEIAEFLIESGADVNAMDGRRLTPLTAAMDAEASDEMIQLIESYGGED